MSHYGWSHFIHDLELAIPQAHSVEQAIQSSIQAMQKLLSNRSLLEPEDAEAVLSGQHDGRIYHSPQHDFVVHLFAWPSGAETPIHDHDTWGVMGVYQGALQVVEYALEPTEQTDAFELGESQQYKAEAGAISYILPPADEIHQISNPWNETAFSIHLYGKPIDNYHIFDLQSQTIRSV